MIWGLKFWTPSIAVLDINDMPFTTRLASNFGLDPEAEAEEGTAMPGICFSASLAADFGPGTEGATEEPAAGRGTYFLRLSPPTSSLARGAQLDRKFAVYAFRRRPLAWPGGGGGGAAYKTGRPGGSSTGGAPTSAADRHHSRTTAGHM